jgi:hypothetical protein
MAPNKLYIKWIKESGITRREQSKATGKDMRQITRYINGGKRPLGSRPPASVRKIIERISKGAVPMESWSL